MGSLLRELVRAKGLAMDRVRYLTSHRRAEVHALLFLDDAHLIRSLKHFPSLSGGDDVQHIIDVVNGVLPDGGIDSVARAYLGHVDSLLLLELPVGVPALPIPNQRLLFVILPVSVGCFA